MNEDQLSQDIKTLVSKVIKVPVEKIDVNANIFTDLGVDSLLGVEIFAALDKKYGLNVPEGKLAQINTLNDVIAMVREMLAGKA
jgi:acyl carrier protein